MSTLTKVLERNIKVIKKNIAVTDRSFQISMGGQMLFKYENLQLKVKGGKFRGNLWNLRKMIFTK